MDLQSCGPPLALGSTCSEAVEPVRKPGVIVLAGGESRRMGMEKGLVPFQGKPMVAHVLAAAAAWGLKEFSSSRRSCPRSSFWPMLAWALAKEVYAALSEWAEEAMDAPAVAAVGGR